MIDQLGRIAQTLQFLRIPTIVVGIASLIVLTVVIFTSQTHEDDIYLIPSIVGLLWAVTTYSFLTGFNSVPHKAEHSWKFFRRVKRNLIRTWYWLLAITFLGTSILAMFVTFRIASIWVGDYLGGQ